MIKTNKNKLVIQEVVGKISHPTMMTIGGTSGSYVTTWNGKPKIGIGVGGIKYNVKVGDSCFGWPEAEYLEPGVALIGIDEKSGVRTIQAARSTAMGFHKLTCIGNKVKVMSGEGKGAIGVVTGKRGRQVNHVLTHFSDEDLEKLSIGDRVRVKAEGTGLEIKGFDGRIFNMSPKFLESIAPEQEDDQLVMPVVKEIPAYAMGYSAGGSPAELGHWCIQASPPELLRELKLGDLCIGDLVACRDILIVYGNSYYKGAVTIGVITFGSSDIGGHGPGVLAIAASKKGKIKLRIDQDANVAKYLGLKG